MKHQFTDQRGYIIDRSESMIVGTWFTSLGHLSFHSTEKYVQQFIDDLQKTGIRWEGNNYTKGTVHDVPFDVVQQTFSIGGLDLIDEETVRADIEKKAEISAIDRVMEKDVQYLDSRYYVVDNDTRRTVALIQFTSKGPIIIDSLDTQVDDIFKKLEKRGVGVVAPVVTDVPKPVPEILEERSFAQIGLVDLESAFSTEYYIVPAPYLEKEDISEPEGVRSSLLETLNIRVKTQKDGPTSRIEES